MTQNFSAPGINRYSYANDDFWRWEYVRRNEEYMRGYDKFVEVLKVHKVDSDKLRRNFSYVCLLMKMKYDLGCYDPVKNSDIVSFMEDAGSAGIFLAQAYGRKPKDYRVGPSSDDLLTQAENDNNDFFQLADDCCARSLETTFHEDGNQLVLTFDKGIEPERLAYEAMYQLLAYRHSDASDDKFFELVKKVDSCNSGCTTRARRVNGNLPRSIGLWLYDYEINRFENRVSAVQFFMEKKSEIICSKTNKASCSEESWVRKCLSNARKSIETMAVIPFA